jgi:predicted PurR-regulated permease PerM
MFAHQPGSGNVERPGHARINDPAALSSPPIGSREEEGRRAAAPVSAARCFVVLGGLGPAHGYARRAARDALGSRGGVIGVADDGSGRKSTAEKVCAPALSPAAALVPAELGGAPPSDGDLVRDLGRRVTALEADRDGPVARREVSVTARSVVEVLGMILFAAAAVGVVYLAWGAITLVLIALLAALALNPAVEFFVRQRLRRGWAAGLVFVLALCALALLGLLLIPPLVTQVSHFIHAVPGILANLSKGHGPFGFLERKFHVVQEAKKLVSGKSVTAVAGPGIGVVLSVAGTLVGLVVIAFLTFFMLLEGPEWVERFMSLLPAGVRPRYRRIGAGISRTVVGFVTGNLLASLLSGAVTTAVLFAAGLPYPVPLGVLVALLDLLPIFGAFIALVIVAAVAFAHGLVTGVVVTGVVFLYHQFEVYYLRPIITGRMIQLSPLAVLVAAVLGVALAGPLGGIAAIPIGGMIQVILVEVLDARTDARAARRRRVIVDGPSAEVSAP